MTLVELNQDIGGLPVEALEYDAVVDVLLGCRVAGSAITGVSTNEVAKAYGAWICILIRRFRRLMRDCPARG